MKQLIDVVKVMTPFPYTIEGSRSLAEALEMLGEKGIDYLPVTEDEQPIGVVSRRDLLIAQRASDPDKSISVGDLCSGIPYIVETSEHLGTVVSHMMLQKIEAAIVVKKGRVVGVFTTLNAFKLLFSLLTGSSVSGVPPDITA